jgi:hypothetical protein
MYADITMLNAVTYGFYTGMEVEGTDKARWHMIGLSPGSPNTYDLESHKRFPNNASGSARALPTLWTMGNYSLFVRPGFQRIGLQSSDLNTANLKGVMGTAYQSPAGYKDWKTGELADRIVAVYVNVGTASRRVAAKFPAGKLPKRIRCFVTSEANTGEDTTKPGMRRQGHNNGVLQLPARSVVTMVYDF